MKTIKDSCIDLLKNEDIRKDMREMIRPICQIIYNEIYIYVWFICLYNVFFIAIFMHRTLLRSDFLVILDGHSTIVYMSFGWHSTNILAVLQFKQNF